MILTDEEIEDFVRKRTGSLDDMIRAVEAAVLAKLADKLRDAERYEWLITYAYVEKCYTTQGTVYEISGTNREVPERDKFSLYTVRDGIDAAMLASKAVKP